MTSYIWVLIGSAIGGMARYGVSGAVARRVGETFPWGTLVVNATGSFVIGLFGALTVPGGVFTDPATPRLLVMVGICGGYTTFSSFSLQTLALTRDSEWMRALGNIVASVALCLFAVWAGFALGAMALGG